MSFREPSRNRALGDRRRTSRFGDAHVAHLNALAEASGLSRNDVVRRILLSHDLPSAESLEDIEKLQRLQAEQNRLGGLLKMALTEHDAKAGSLAVPSVAPTCRSYLWNHLQLVVDAAPAS
jgi:hypothetical protein